MAEELVARWNVFQLLSFGPAKFLVLAAWKGAVPELGPGVQLCLKREPFRSHRSESWG